MALTAQEVYLSLNADVILLILVQVACVTGMLFECTVSVLLQYLSCVEIEMTNVLTL